MTNMGGAVTLPVAIPANMASTLYIQLRMITGIAHIGGHDRLDDRIKTLCHLCLTGNSAAEIIKTINKTVGFRLAPKAGSTGLLNVTKMVPPVGGILTNIVGNTARKAFIHE